MKKNLFIGFVVVFAVMSIIAGIRAFEILLSEGGFLRACDSWEFTLSVIVMFLSLVASLFLLGKSLDYQSLYWMYKGFQMFCTDIVVWVVLGIVIGGLFGFFLEIGIFSKTIGNYFSSATRISLVIGPMIGLLLGSISGGIAWVRS